MANPKFFRGNSVIVVKKSSIFLGKVGTVSRVNESGFFFEYAVRFDDFDSRDILFNENEIARTS